jgi:hypothetical protein
MGTSTGEVLRRDAVSSDRSGAVIPCVITKPAIVDPAVADRVATLIEP